MLHVRARIIRSRDNLSEFQVKNYLRKMLTFAKTSAGRVGRYPLIFCMATCITPFYLKSTGMSFPCGRCVYCKKRRASSWSFRLQHHMRKNPLASFVTLTYNTDHVPITEKRRMSLDKDHIKNFFKRLRQIQERKDKALFDRGIITKYYGKKISYYLAGEYGSKYSRPHYHIILFNCAPESVIRAWRDPKSHAPFGSLYFGTVAPASISYTLKYISKDAKVPQYKGDDRVPEFQRMSKGIGLGYITSNRIKWHLNDLFGRSYGQLLDSDIKVALPRYYKDRIYTALERQMIGEALQSKQLEETYWGTYPQHVNNLVRINEYEFIRLQYDKLKIDTYKNSLNHNKDQMF